MTAKDLVAALVCVVSVMVYVWGVIDAPEREGEL